MIATVDWYVCTANADDVRYWTRPIRKADRKHERERMPNLKVGDELWRMPLSIGPIGIDHDPWSGWHLTCTPKQAERIAELINADPDFPWGEA